MGMGFAPTWLRQVSPPPPRLHMTTLTTAACWFPVSVFYIWITHSIFFFEFSILNWGNSCFFYVLPLCMVRAHWHCCILSALSICICFLWLLDLVYCNDLCLHFFVLNTLRDCSAIVVDDCYHHHHHHHFHSHYSSMMVYHSCLVDWCLLVYWCW